MDYFPEIFFKIFQWPLLIILNIFLKFRKSHSGATMEAANA